MRRATSRWIAVGSCAAVLLAACGESSGNDDAGGEVNDTNGGDESAEEPVASPYEGETIEIIVPFGAGGSIDSIGRLMGEMLGAHVSGSPRVQVVNLEGGGAILGANEFAQSRDPDGLTLLVTSGSVLLPYVFGDTNVAYDPAEMVPLWATNRGASTIFAKPDSGIANAADLVDGDAELYMGDTNPVGAGLPAFVGLEVLGVGSDINYIFGYEGGESIRNAYEAGELNINRDATVNYAQDFGSEVALYTHGVSDGAGGLERDPALPDVPHLAEVFEEMNGTEPSGEAWDSFMLLQDIMATGGVALWTHGDAPQERVDALREALATAIEDDQYLETIDNLNGPYEALIDDDVVSWATTLTELDSDVVRWTQEFVRDRFDLDITE